MKTAVKISDLTKAHGVTPPGMMFYDTLQSVRKDINLLGYVSVIERAWEELKLNGVLCLDCRPVLYFKENGRPLSLRDRLPVAAPGQVRAGPLHHSQPHRNRRCCSLKSHGAVWKNRLHPEPLCTPSYF